MPDPTGFIPRLLIADLPTCNDSPSRGGRVYVVTDPADSNDCTVGGGSSMPHLCVCNGAGAAWSALPVPTASLAATIVQRAAAQSIADTTPTFISFDTEIKDDDGWWDLVPDPTRLTFDATSHIFTTITMTTATTPSGKSLRLRSFINGILSGTPIYFATAATAGSSASFPFIVAATAGLYIEVEVFQDTGSPLDITATANLIRIQ